MLLTSTESYFDDVEAQQQQQTKIAHPKRQEMMDSLDLQSDRDEDDEETTTLARDILIDNMDLVAGLSSSHKPQHSPVNLTPPPPRPWDANNTMGSLLSSSPSETPDGQMEEPYLAPTLDDGIEPDNCPLTTGQRNRSPSPAAATSSSILVGSAVDDNIRTRKSFSKQRVFI